MDKNRAFLRHEILNIITLVNFLVMDLKLPVEKKNELLEHLKMIGLLSGEQEFILGKGKKLLNQKVHLHEALEIVGHILENHARKKKVKLSIASTEMIVKGDMNAIKNGIEQILLCLIEMAKVVSLKVNEKSNTLEIHYSSAKPFQIGKETALDFLKKRHTYSEIFCKMAVELMKKCGVKVDFKKNLILLKFNKIK